MAAYSNPNPGDSVVLNVSKLASTVVPDYIRRWCLVSAGDTTITEGEIQEIASDEITDIFDTSTTAYQDTETYKILVAYFSNNANGTINVLEVGSTSVADSVAGLSTFLTAGINLCYHYICPSSFYTEATFVTLVTLYNSDTSATYFEFMITYGSTPTSDTDFANYIGLKSCFAVYPTSDTDVSTVGEMAGKMASSLYDLSTSNKLTMLQWKSLASASAEDLTTSFRTDLVNNAVNFVGQLIGNDVIFNGRYLDNTPFDYWYAWDWIMFDLEAYLQTALYNSSNTPSAVIQYNQSGIDKLLGVINQRLNTGKKIGAINEFAESIDNTGTELVNTGSFLATDFQTYKTDYPSNYSAGIYDGFSGYIMIMNFFRQVTINITLT